jgi:dynactin complex subunit
MSTGLQAVGCRVIDSEGYRATVRYIGPVAGAKNKDEIWFGVEWDNATRGKHDGSSADSSGVLHKYFECVPGSGSFIKPTKVTYGRSFLEALNDRYVRLDAPTIAEANAVLPNAFVTTSKGNQKSIEFVGEEKIRL